MSSTNSGENSGEYQPKTAGLILIGNELLSGQTQDLNMNYIAKKLYTHGAELRETIVIPDCPDKIIQVVQEYHKRFSYVFTTGGIGPTHDDITAACLSRAFNKEHVIHPEAYQLFLEKYDEDEMTPGRVQMTKMPEGSQLIYNSVSMAPGFVVENVYVMAGIPSVMQSMLESVLTMIEKGQQRHKKIVFCEVFESVLAPGLEKLQADHPTIEIGSYPNWPEGKPSGVKVAVSGYNKDLVDQISQEIMTLCRSFEKEPQLYERDPSHSL